MLFTLRIFIWFNLISSLCVVVSWFTVFFHLSKLALMSSLYVAVSWFTVFSGFFMSSTVESWWGHSGVRDFLCLDSCVYYFCTSGRVYLCAQLWLEEMSNLTFESGIICTSHKLIAKNAKIRTRWSTVLWQWDRIKALGPSLTCSYDIRCSTTKNRCQHIPSIEKEGVWVAVDHASRVLSFSNAFVRSHVVMISQNQFFWPLLLLTCCYIYLKFFSQIIPSNNFENLFKHISILLLLWKLSFLENCCDVFPSL